MRQILEIYPGREKVWKKEVIRLNKSPISKKNLELILSWHDHLFATGTGPIRVAKLSSQIRRIAVWVQKDLNILNKKDIESLLGKINRSEKWTEATKADYRRCIKQFYQWFKEEDPRILEGDIEIIKLYNYIEKQIKINYKERSYDYSEVINDEDIQQVLDVGCSNIKEKTFLAVLHESGLRAGEMLNLQIRDIEFKESNVVLKVDGKTGIRRVPLVFSMGYISRWLDEHPDKNNRESYLWLGNNQKFKNQPIRHVGAQKLINRCFIKANLQKKHNLHWFRHSRATINASFMTEVILCKFFGWVLGSKQVRRYVHSNVQQVEDSILKVHGLQKNEEKDERVKQCFCGMVNGLDSRYCHRCGKPLNVNILLEDENKKKLAVDEAFEFFEMMSNNPEIMERFRKFNDSIKQGTN